MLGGLNTQCLGSVLVGIKRGDNSAVSGNLTALAYVLSSRFANAFSKVAAHMRAYYLMVDPPEAVDEQPGAKSAGGASHSSHDASSSDSSDDDRSPLGGMPHAFEAGKHQQYPPKPTDRPPTQPLMPREPSSRVEVYSQDAEQRHPLSSGRFGSTSTSVVAPVPTCDSDSSARPAHGRTPASTGTHRTGQETAEAGTSANLYKANEQCKQPLSEPSSSSKGADQEEDVGKMKRRERGAPDVRQRPFWLTFRKGELEQAFIGWHATHQAKGDLIGGFLAFFIELAAMKDPTVKEGVMASGRPLVATLSLFCILVVMLLRPQWWRKAREAYMSTLLIAMAAQAVWAFTPCVAVQLPPAKLRDPVWFARLIYAEAMAVMPVIFVVRFRTLARNQAVLLALAMGRALPYVCSLPGAGEPFGACIGGGILLLALIGFLLPLSILWAFEVYARRNFLASPAAEALARKST
ncbi:g2434 [Coccomyxa elongata]